MHPVRGFASQWVGLAVLLLAMPAAIGCGDDETEEDRVTAAVERMHEDLSEGRFREVCAAMTSRPSAQIGTVGHRRRPTTCIRDLAEFIREIRQSSRAYGGDEDLQRAARPEVTDVRFAGREKATVTMTLGADPFEVPYVMEDGEWKLDDFFGAVGPPPRALR